MLEFFRRLFAPEPRSSDTAKERLRLVLLSDHLSLAPDVVEALKRDLLAVISRYLEIDPAQADVTFEQREREVAMLASIPIMGVRARSEPLPEAVAPKAGIPVVDPAPASPIEAQTPAPAEPQPEDEAMTEPGAPAEPHAPVMKTAVPEEAPRPSPAGSSARRRRRKKAAALANGSPQTQAAPGFGPA